MNIFLPQEFIYIIAFVVSWVSLWQVLSAVLFLFSKPDEDSHWLWILVFFLPAIVIWIMERSVEDVNDESVFVAWLTWGYRSLFHLVLSVVRSVFLFVAFVFYGLFALARRIVTLRQDMLSSYIFALVQTDMGYLDPVDVQATIQELEDEAYAYAWMAAEEQQRARQAHEDMELHQILASYASSRGWSHSQLQDHLSRTNGMTSIQQPSSFADSDFYRFMDHNESVDWNQ